MKALKKTPRKSKAQAMVEFAIALPILLMLMYGVLETGRFLFLYSTVVTASRQAVRYGTATGDGNEGEKRYNDCDGIRAAANAAAYLGAFDSITIENDTGPGSGQNAMCDPVSETVNNPLWAPSTNNTDRLIVTVTEQFTPIVPAFVNFIQRNVTATSARTILISVNIIVTAPAGSYSGTDLALEINPVPATVNVPQTVTISYVVTNNSTTDLNTPITIVTDKGSWSCAGEPGTLTASGGTFTCTGTYAVSQTEIDAGVSIPINATVTVGGDSDTAQGTISIGPLPALSLTKTPDIPATNESNKDIVYTYTLTNTGNVTLSGPYDINDDLIADSKITCPSDSTTVDPGNSVTCTGDYRTTNSDISAGSIVNTATATAMHGSTTVTSNSVSAIVYTPAIYITVVPSTYSVNTVGQTITYVYNLQNVTGGQVRSPYTITDSQVASVDCSGADPNLNSYESTTCTGAYTVTQSDLDAGFDLTSSVTATAIKDSNPGSGSTLSSNPATTSISVVQNPSLGLTVSANPATATNVGDVVTYTYTLTNNGNVTLTSPSVTDDKATTTCADTSAIAPGGTRVCTGTRSITSSDIADGSVVNTATASTLLGTTTVSSNSASATVTTFVGPRLTLEIESNPTTFTSAGDIITFTYVLKNTGTVVLSTPYSVTSTISGAGDCSGASASIPTGGSTTCIGLYTITGSDIVSTIITNQASASAFDGVSTINSSSAMLDVYLTGVPTRTPTFTPLPTFTLSPTSTASPTVTNTSTPTATFTPSFTPIPDRIVSGSITIDPSVLNGITAGSVTITGTLGGSCSKPTASTYTCTMTTGSGTMIVGNYSTSTGAAANRNNMVCTSIATPSGTVSGSGTGETTTFVFSGLSGNVTFNIRIAKQGAATPAGYFCHP